MKTRSLVLAALAPLVAISGANAAMDEMEAPEMRVWGAVLSEPSEEAHWHRVANHRESVDERKQRHGHRERSAHQHGGLGGRQKAT